MRAPSASCSWWKCTVLRDTAAVELDRHVDQAERDRAAPDRSSHRVCSWLPAAPQATRAPGIAQSSTAIALSSAVNGFVRAQAAEAACTGLRLGALRRLTSAGRRRRPRGPRRKLRLDRRQWRLKPLLAQQRVGDHVATLIAVAVEGAQGALAHEAQALERALRAGLQTSAQAPSRSIASESKARRATSALLSAFAPVPQ